MIFTDKSNICFTSGEIAQNIEIIEFDLEKERRRINKIYDGKVIITSIDQSDSKDWKQFINKQIGGHKIVNYQGLCDGSIILSFKEKSIEIFAQVDNVNARIAAHRF